MSTGPHIQRLMQLEGSYNLRDIGDYETRDGHHIRRGTIFRSGNLDRLPLVSQQTLINKYGIKTILDLRSHMERERYPDVFASSSRVTYTAIPLVETTLPLWQKELPERYQLLFLHCQETFKALLEAIATSDIPLIIHCTAGKDRTGLMIALLLSMAGVSERQIAEDYALSEGYLVAFFREVRQHIQNSGRDMQRFERDCQAPPELILQTFAFLHHQFGGTISYVRQIGVSEDVQRCLKQMLILSY